MKTKTDCIRRRLSTDYYGGSLWLVSNGYGIEIHWQAYQGGTVVLDLMDEEAVLLADVIVSSDAYKRATQADAEFGRHHEPMEWS